jgi:hypothetical protein
VVFFASVVALDFGWGMVFKTALQATIIHDAVRLEMVVSVMLMVLTPAHARSFRDIDRL